VIKHLENGWELNWTENPDYPGDITKAVYAAARKGDCHVHKSLDLYTAWIANPFRAIGLFPTAQEAMNEAESENYKPADLP
jgi:hypothetical protein